MEVSHHQQRVVNGGVNHRVELPWAVTPGCGPKHSARPSPVGVERDFRGPLGESDPMWSTYWTPLDERAWQLRGSVMNVQSKTFHEIAFDHGHSSLAEADGPDSNLTRDSPRG